MTDYILNAETGLLGTLLTQPAELKPEPPIEQQPDSLKPQENDLGSV